MASGKKLFISQVPRPYQRLSFSVSVNGSLCQRLSSNGTVSVWPDSTNPPGPLPRVAIRLYLPGIPGTSRISTANPIGSSHSARVLTTASLLWSQSGDALLMEGNEINRVSMSRMSGTVCNLSVLCAMVASRPLISVCPAPPPDIKLGDGPNQYWISHLSAGNGA